jgi:iron complex outermembrane receptor protein
MLFSSYLPSLSCSLRSRTFRAGLLCLLPSAFSPILSAAVTPVGGNASDSVALDRFVITATRSAKDINDAPGTLTLFTSAQLEKRRVERIGDILRETPGLYGALIIGGQNVPSAQGGRFTLRGIPGAQRTLVLVDDVPYNDSYLGNVSWASIFMEDVQRVEVLPGSASALYGGNAIGGVVHVISRIPENREVHLTGTRQWGDVAQNAGSFVYRDRLSRFFAVSLGVKRETSTGYREGDLLKTPVAGAPGLPVSGAVPTVNAAGASVWRIGHQSPRPWEADTAQAKIFATLPSGAQFSTGVINYEANARFAPFETYLRDAAGQPVSAGTLAIGGQRFTLTESEFLSSPAHDGLLRAFGTYRQDLRPELHARAGFSYSRRGYHANNVAATSTFAGGGAGTLTDAPTRNVDAFAQTSGRFGASHHWVAGVSGATSRLNRKAWNLSDWRNRHARTGLTGTADGNSENLAVFGQDEIALPRRATLFLGARFDSFSTHGAEADLTPAVPTRTTFAERRFNEFSPRVAAVAPLWADATARASVGRAFRSPTLFDFYVVSRRGTTVTLSNPNLDPESVVTWEAGLHQRLPRSGTSAKATFFDNELRDLIYSRSLSATTRQAVNAGRAWSRGVVLDVTQDLGRTSRITFGYTRTASRIDQNVADPTSVGKQMVNVPRNLFSAVVDSNFGRWHGNLGVFHVGDSFDTAANTDVVSGVYGRFSRYWLVNAHLTFRVNRHVEALLSVENLLDAQYYQFNHAAGRTAALSLRLRY